MIVQKQVFYFLAVRNGKLPGITFDIFRKLSHFNNFCHKIFGKIFVVNSSSDKMQYAIT